jgi:hypothetical protein
MMHKLSRRALLAGVCGVPLVRHVGLDPASTLLPLAEERRWTPDQVRGDGVRRECWRRAVGVWERAQAEIGGLAQSEDEGAYDDAVERQIGALGWVLGAAAPDGEAVVWKLELIASQRVFELDCWEGAVVVLKGDVRRLG